MQKYHTIYIDFPDKDKLKEDKDSIWTNATTLENATKAEALAWIREYVGPCDDEGRVKILTLGEPVMGDLPAPVIRAMAAALRAAGADPQATAAAILMEAGLHDLARTVSEAEFGG